MLAVDAALIHADRGTDRGHAEANSCILRQ